MRKCDIIKQSTPFIFCALWTCLFINYDVNVEKHSVIVVGLWLVLVLGSIKLSDYGLEFFDKDDREEE